ncbi:MAG: hypothetical protein R3B68_14885 [Phycisphaerales bacterium]
MAPTGPMDIVGRVAFARPEHGGRQQPLVREHHKCVFQIDGANFDCLLDLRGIGSVWPGETKSIPISFLMIKLARPHLRVGAPFTLWEGKTIATGIIESACPTD